VRDEFSFLAVKLPDGSVIRNDTGGVAAQARLYPFHEDSAPPGATGQGNGQNAMTTFDDRQKAFENKFAHDQDMRFRAMARRNKLLGLWAAEKLGKSGAEADEYAKSVVLADFEEPGDEDVFRKVRGDLDASVSDSEIREQMTTLLARAAEEVQKGS